MNNIQKKIIRGSGLLYSFGERKRGGLIVSKLKFLLMSVLFLFMNCQAFTKKKDTLILKDYRVFFDGQQNGYGTIYGNFVLNGNELLGIFIGGGKYGDDEIGMRPFIIRSIDHGETWSEPHPFASDLIGDLKKESLTLGILGPTRNGTLITRGFHFKAVNQAKGYYQDTEWRTYTLLVGRKEENDTGFHYQQYPSGTFLGEQFVDGGIQLPNGRLICSLWGARKKGENWRCGVLVSDDDGVSWKYRDVAYEADLKIRDNPEISAGFNEQTLFVTSGGKIVSIIRGRANLGRVKDSPRDTWFFRSESLDNGETWSKYELTDIAGTGAAAVGLTLPDGSLLQACRVPYSRKLYPLAEQDLYGLHFARSFDEGKTWHSEHIIQCDPEGEPFANYYNVMNGQFLKISNNEWFYIFGQFDIENKVYRILSCRLQVQ